MGKTISYGYYFPQKTISWKDITKVKIPLKNGDSLVVGDGIDIGGRPDPGHPNPATDDLYTVDISARHILFDFNNSALWTNATFNGPVFEDRLDNIRPILDVKLKTNMPGLDERDIAFSENRIVINWQGASHDDLTYILLTITFGPNRVAGSASADRLVGTNDTDTIMGMNGDDTLVGNAADDELIGGVGRDRLDGGAGTDTASYSTSAGGLTVSLASPGTNTGDAAGDTFVAIENLTGSAYADVLTGNTGANRLFGAAGDDILAGGAGADRLHGGTGDDTVTFAAATSAVTAKLAFWSDNRGDAAGDIYHSVENLTGSKFADELWGSNGRNLIDGGLGNDILNGRGGRDMLVGGGGRDSFLFDMELSRGNVDEIDDFVVSDDTIQLDLEIFRDLGAGRLAASAFYASTTGTAHDADDRILYEIHTGRLFYDKDGTGGAAALQFAVVDSHLSLTAADFFGL